MRNRKEKVNERYSVISFLCCFLSLTSFAESEFWVSELNKIDMKLEKLFSKKYRLFMTGVGGGGVQGFYRYSPQFQQDSPTTQELARELILTLAEEILNEVNSNEILKQGMISYPFTHENLGLDIYYRKPDGHFVDEDDICVVSICKNRIEYGLHDNKIAPMKTINEPIKEALLKIEGSREKFPFIWKCVEKQEKVQ